MSLLILLADRLPNVSWSDTSEGTVSLEARKTGRRRRLIEHVLDAQDGRQKRTPLVEYRTVFDGDDDEPVYDEDTEKKYGAALSSLNAAAEFEEALRELAAICGTPPQSLPPAHIALHGDKGRYWLTVDPTELQEKDDPVEEVAGAPSAVRTVLLTLLWVTVALGFFAMGYTLFAHP